MATLPQDQTRNRRRSKGLPVIVMETLAVIVDMDPTNKQALIDAKIQPAFQAEPTPFDATRTMGQQIEWLLDEWEEVKDVQPSHFVKTNKVLCGQKGARLGRHEISFKTGFAAHLIVCAFFGPKYRFQETKEGTLAGYIGQPIYTKFLKPMAELLAENCNVLLNATGNSKNELVLEADKILDCNIPNWLLSQYDRAANGIWSNEEMERLGGRIGSTEGDNDLCKGFFYPWALKMMQVNKEFYGKIGAGKVFITDTQNNLNNYTIAMVNAYYHG